MKKAIGMFVALIMALGMTGMAYACWSDTLHVYGDVDTGNVDIHFSIDGCWDTDDYASYGQLVSPLKDVSHVCARTNYYSRLWVFINNAYPCIDYYVRLNVDCVGSIPVHVYLGQITGNLPLGSTVELLPDGQATIPLRDGIQIHPGEQAYAILHVHLPQNAGMNTEYNFEVDILGVQWNCSPE